MAMKRDEDNWWEDQFNGFKTVYWRLALPFEIWTGSNHGLLILFGIASASTSPTGVLLSFEVAWLFDVPLPLPQRWLACMP